MIVSADFAHFVVVVVVRFFVFWGGTFTEEKDLRYYILLSEFTMGDSLHCL